MKGDKEQKCLDLVKQVIFTNNGDTIYHPFTGKTYTEVDSNEFANEQIWFINSNCRKNYFGLLEEDSKQLEQILRIAQTNEKLSEFPDFKFDYGYIEHFQVSSSKLTRKGAEHIREMNCFVSNVNAETESLKQAWNKTPSFDKVRSKHWTMNNPKHSHSFLINSFKTHWKNHIDSLNNYTGNKDVGIFMIEYTDIALAMVENVYNDWISGMSQGDMRTPEKFHCYRLTRDKVLLDFIYQYKDKIKYVIFVYHEGFEIIKLESIPYLLKLIPWEYDIHPLVVENIASLYNISDSTDFRS